MEENVDHSSKSSEEIVRAVEIMLPLFNNLLDEATAKGIQFTFKTQDKVNIRWVKINQIDLAEAEQHREFKVKKK